MEFLPIFLDLKGQKVVIVGGGRIASRKAALVHSAGAEIVVVSPRCGEAMHTWLAENQRCSWVEADFAVPHLEGASLVIAATDLAEVNHAVYDAAKARGLPVNVADQPHLCSFILPAIVDRSPAVIAISTGGRSPILARYLKAKLEQFLPFGVGTITGLLGRWREGVKHAIVDEQSRKRFWERLIDGPIGEAALSGHTEKADAMIATALQSHAESSGKVYIIGAGPGNPELLTIRAQRLLQRADVVLYDRLVGREILSLCRREARLIFVGKRASLHYKTQAQTEALMVKLAKQGLRVARLKGGDPFVFGRGGEECQTLRAEGIDYEVVPGISAANGASAYAGIPLTHRDHTHGVSYVSGDAIASPVLCKALVASAQTLVVYMGLSKAAELAANLQTAGMSAEMPVAVVSAGTTVAQQTLVSTLDHLEQDIRAAHLPSPALLIVGSVVSLRAQLNWMEERGDIDAEQVFSTPDAMIGREAA